MDIDREQIRIASDNEDTVRQTHYTENVNQEEEEESAPKPVSKLPSFKKKSRDVDDAENARLEEVRREIREMKNSAPSRDDVEEEDEGPIDPRQGNLPLKQIVQPFK